MFAYESLEKDIGLVSPSTPLFWGYIWWKWDS